MLTKSITFYDSVFVIWQTHSAHPAEVFYFSFPLTALFLGGANGGSEVAMTLNLFYSFPEWPGTNQ